MIRFGYKSYDGDGRRIEGEIVSDSREAALEALRRRGEFPVEVLDGGLKSAQSWWQREVFSSRQIPLSGLALFMRELATLVKAQLPLDEVLRIVALQPLLPARVRTITRSVLERVMEGQSLSQALATQDDAIPNFIWRLVQAGEASGKLGDVLDDIAGFLERSAKVRAQIISALLYPLILVIAAVIAVGVIMAVLLPAIVPLIEDANARLPLVIAVLESIRQTLTTHWLVVSVTAGAAIIIATLSLKSAPVQSSVSRLVLAVPIVGGLVMSRETARFSRTLATLMKSGVPMLEAIRISGGVLKNVTFQNAVLDIGQQVRQGATLSRPLADCGLFPELAVRLITVGEKAGQLETMLIRVSDVFESTLQRRLSRLTALLTPALTLLIGLLVGGLIVSVMGALLSINQLAVN